MDDVDIRDQHLTVQLNLDIQFSLGSAIQSVPNRIRDLVDRVGFTR